MNSSSDFSFGKVNRILSGSDYTKVKNQGCRRTSRNLILIQLKNDLNVKRIGVIVTKKVGKASVRNQWKRYVKEFFRLNKKIFPASTDSVFIVKRGMEVPGNFNLISDELKRLVIGKR